MNIKREQLTSALATIAIALQAIATGCSPSIYAPNAQNVPMVRRAGEAHLSASVGVLERFPDTYEAQGAYALTDRVALMANLMMVSYKKPDSLTSITVKGQVAEAGGGLYKEFSSNLVGDVYAGFGGGSVTTTDRRTDSLGRVYMNNFSAGIYRFFVQPSFGFTSRYFDAAVSVRACMVRYSAPDTSNIMPGYMTDNHLENVNRQTFFFLEPAFTVRAGDGNLKLQGQLVWPSLLVGGDKINHQGSNANIGLCLMLGRTNQ